MIDPDGGEKKIKKKYVGHSIGGHVLCFSSLLLLVLLLPLRAFTWSSCIVNPFFFKNIFIITLLASAFSWHLLSVYIKLQCMVVVHTNSCFFFL